MPYPQYDKGRQRSHSFNHTTNGLMILRGQQLRALRLGTDIEAQANVDAIDRMLVNCIGYTGDIAEASRDFQREALVSRGELRWAVMDALRHSNGPQTTRQLAETVHAAKGVPTTPDRIGKERINRVRAVRKKLTTVER